MIVYTSFIKGYCEVFFVLEGFTNPSRTGASRTCLNKYSATILVYSVNEPRKIKLLAETFGNVVTNRMTVDCNRFVRITVHRHRFVFCCGINNSLWGFL